MKRKTASEEKRDRESAVISIYKLSKKYKNKVALDELSLTVHRGEIFGLLGPNGSGKTTTINIMTGLLKPDSGYCQVFGKDSTGLDESIYSKIGVVFEEKNLYLRLTGYQNLGFFASLYGVGEDIINSLLEKYDLLEAAHRQVKTYSKGMRQRLLLCRALLNDPELLILDEPTDGLDPLSLKIIHNSLKELRAEGKTIFLSTHYMEEAERLCDRLAFLNKGRLVAINSPGELKESFGEDSSLNDIFIKLTNK
ncbi:MAG TPA: ABC transporter ATP-binding protein [Halanaerobiaceae bacterium]|nr:ABC transporter ATP-binding protein [Bacillota bacterium]HHU92427.1 ABC transporter ATP-binding protein [Halanaerobiaceae bacterium]HOA40555.1 ABC transporter ATP-binding protein [Halanaerobiales bacterium]HPZ62719.1 ABC transporter ATP-binding protein [Halanaerobiales bacterium]HQD04070.1 ABC transporter ATP-binding protein [Halanaerobiales bacterium]